MLCFQLSMITKNTSNFNYKICPEQTTHKTQHKRGKKEDKVTWIFWNIYYEKWRGFLSLTVFALQQLVVTTFEKTLYVDDNTPTTFCKINALQVMIILHISKVLNSNITLNIHIEYSRTKIAVSTWQPL